MLQPRLTPLATSSLAVTQVGELQPPAAHPTGALLLEKRATCPANYPVNCGVDDDPWCCASGWTCSTDADGDPACCPSGAVCTGSVPEETQLSFVQNTYYPFPYIHTSFSNDGVCSAAYTSCTANYRVCTAGLEGTGSYGVTIDVAGGGGTTVAIPGATLAPASAESICSSLSSIACHGGLDEAICQQTGRVGVFVVSAAARETAPPGLFGPVAFAAIVLTLMFSSFS